MSRAVSSLQLEATEKAALLKLFPKGIISVDLETTGLSPLVDKIIEVAAVKISPAGEVSTYHQLINPLIEVPEFTVQFHGLRNQDLQFSPTIKKPLKDFWSFCERLPVIGHNSSFDLGYLIKASHDFQLEFPPLDIYDSCRWARSCFKKLDPTPQNFKLSTLCEFFNIPLKHHVALEDAMACLKIMGKVASLEEAQEQHQKKSYIFRLSQFDRSECFNFSTRLKGLTQLVQEKKLLTIEYRAGESQRPLRPIGLMPLPQGAVLFAECLLTGMNKSYQLKKIKSFKPLEATYWKDRGLKREVNL